MHFGFEEPVTRNSKQMNNILRDVEMVQTNRGAALFVQYMYVFLFLIVLPVLVTMMYNFKVPLGISILYYVIAWIVFFLISFHNQPSAGVAPSVLDIIISCFRKGKRFMVNQDDYIASIKKHDYEPLIDSLIMENQEILSRKTQQDSDRFNLFFNGLLIFFLTMILTFKEKIWAVISTGIVSEYVILNMPLIISIIALLIIGYFHSGDLFHEMGDDYNIHLTLQDALFELKNDDILVCDKRYNRSCAKKRQVR